MLQQNHGDGRQQQPARVFEGRACQKGYAKARKNGNQVDRWIERLAPVCTRYRRFAVQGLGGLARDQASAGVAMLARNRSSALRNQSAC
jgi:hypothetical protein